jgi:hypothetical protein
MQLAQENGAADGGLDGRGGAGRVHSQMITIIIQAVNSAVNDLVDKMKKVFETLEKSGAESAAACSLRYNTVRKMGRSASF